MRRQRAGFRIDRESTEVMRVAHYAARVRSVARNDIEDAPGVMRPCVLNIGWQHHGRAPLERHRFSVDVIAGQCRTNGGINEGHTGCPLPPPRLRRTVTDGLAGPSKRPRNAIPLQFERGMILTPKSTLDQSRFRGLLRRQTTPRLNSSLLNSSLRKQCTGISAASRSRARAIPGA